jgi:hypothetical protein
MAVASAAANNRWRPAVSARSRAPATILSSTRGTMSRMVGRNTGSCLVRGPGPGRYPARLPARTMQSATTRARMCDSGRKNRVDASSASTRSRTPGTAMTARTAAVRLPWLSMQPFGRPVLPEV